MERRTVSELEDLARRIRLDIVEMTGFGEHTGHLGGACSSADILAVLYGRVMRHDPNNPDLRDRDKFLCSKGHAAIVQYAAMAETGYFPKEELKTFKVLGSRLQGHPDRLKLKGIEAGTGSLGQGLSIACGMVMAMKLDGIDGKVFCLMGDGELAEGQIWEAAFAAKVHRLTNLVGIVDRNRLQATGFVADRFNTSPLEDKWQACGWNVIKVDGHDIRALADAFENLPDDRPTVMIADTVKGKGISFAEDKASFHNCLLTEEQYKAAIDELSGRTK
jgi:transketolase